MIVELLGLGTYSAAYSTMPVVIQSDNIDLSKFNYLLNVCWNSSIIGSMSTYGNNIYTQCYVPSHGFKRGENVFIYTDQYQGYYIVDNVLDVDNIVINLVMDIPYTGTSSICNYISYRQPIDPDGLMKVDLMDTIKNYVSSDIEDTSEIIDGSDSRFDFFLVYAENYDYEFVFTDNIFDAGLVSFINPGITTSIPTGFEIGDTVTIEMDIYSWPTTGNLFVGGDLGFTGSTTTEFEIGDVIMNITGQINNPQYGGPTTVFDKLNDYSIVVDKGFNTVSSPDDPGFIYGRIPAVYNVTTTITNIQFGATYGQQITVDVAYDRNCTIPGRMFKQTPNPVLNIMTASDIYSAYNMRFDRMDYIQYGGYDKDIVKDNYILGIGDNISTIWNNDTSTYNKIEYETKAHLLTHNSATASYGFKYRFFTSESNLLSNNPIGTSWIYGATGSSDLYFPVGIRQIASASNIINSGGWNPGLSYSLVKYYTINTALQSTGATTSNLIYYKINDVCNGGLDKIKVMWKDALGSWISYSFNQVNTKSTEVNQSSYYRREGRYSNDFSSFDLNSMDRGDSVFQTIGRDFIKVESGFVQDYENKLFKDLIKSSEIYVQDVDGNLIAVTKENSNIIYGEEFVNPLYNYAFTFKYAFNDFRY